jgi:hypothetical protein
MAIYKFLSEYKDCACNGLNFLHGNYTQFVSLILPDAAFAMDLKIKIKEDYTFLISKVL